MVIASCSCFVGRFVVPKLNKLNPNATSAILWVNFVDLLTHFVAPEGKFFNETTTQQHSGQTWSMPKWIIFGRLRQFPVKHFKGKQLSHKAIKNIETFVKIRASDQTFQEVRKIQVMPSTAYFDEVSLNTWVPCGPAFRPRSPIWSVISVHETCLAVHP